MGIDIISRVVLFIVLLLTIVLPGWSQEYFHPGMCWLHETFRQDPVDPTCYYPIVVVEDGIEVDGEIVYPMEMRYASFPEVVYCPVYIKNDGSRVYYRERNSSGESWRLMYDFGLDVGEECDIWQATLQEGLQMEQIHVKCVGRYTNPELYCGLEVMELIFGQTIGSYFEYPGLWIVGIGTPMGVYYNYQFNVDGLTTRLIEVKDGDKVIYTQPSLSVDDPDMDDFGVSIEGKELIISRHDDVRVFDMAGRLVGSVSGNKGSEARISVLESGLYLVVSGRYVRKVAVR